MRRLLLAAALVLTGCTPVYLPNTVDPAVLEGAGDVRVAAHAATSGVNLQVAAGLTEHLGLMAHANRYTWKDDHVTASGTRADEVDVRRGYLGEVGFGYGDPVAGVSLFGGIGRGRATAVDHVDFFGTTTYRAEGTFDRAFLQGTIRRGRGPAAALLTVRASYVHFHAFETDGRPREGSRSVPFLEPALTFEVGAPAVRLQTQLGLALPMAEPAFEAEPFFASIGLVVRPVRLLGADR